MTRTVLLVDDDAAIRTSVKDLLETEGFRVLTAGNGQEAWDVLQVETPHCILLDLMMPVMSGGDLLAAMRKDRRFRSVHVVILSAWLSSRATQIARSEHVHVLSKPIDSVALLKMVRKCTAGRVSPPSGTKRGGSLPAQS